MHPTVLACAVLASSLAAATANASPAAYSITQEDAMFGAAHLVTVQRDGDRAAVELGPLAGDGPRVRTLYDLAAGTFVSWDPAAAKPECKRGRFTYDFGDPFHTSSGLLVELPKRHPKEVGKATVAGLVAQVTEADWHGSGRARFTVAKPSGLILKLEALDPKGPPELLLEVRSVELASPPANAFALPAVCGSAP